MAHPMVSLHKVCHVTVPLIAMFSERTFTSKLNLVSKEQKGSQYKLPLAVYFALDTAALHTLTNRPRGSFKVLDRVLILARDL